MVRHNNMISFGHFHKKWQRRVTTWFDQPMKKRKRHAVRCKKVLKAAPQPVKLLRPLVHCPSFRYHSKIRAGRGFSLQELKKAGINRRYARTIGIAVDHRRRTRCVESLQRNTHRLKNYRAKLIVFPTKEVNFSTKDLNKLSQAATKPQVSVVTDEMRNFSAFITLRRARGESKRGKRRHKKKAKKTEAADMAKLV